MTYLVLTYKLYIVSNTYHTPEHYVCKWIVDGTSIEGKSGSRVFMSVGSMKTSMHLRTYLLELSRLSKKKLHCNIQYAFVAFDAFFPLCTDLFIYQQLKSLYINEDLHFTGENSRFFFF